MTNLAAIIFGKLSADPAITMIVGSRIYPNHLPQGVEYPAAAFHVISETPVASLAGYTSQLRRARVQIDIYARSYAPARQTADAVHDVLGSVTETGFSSLRIAGRDMWEAEGEGSDGLHRVSQDFSIWVADG